MKNAKAKRTRNNVIVHIILAILAAIWVFPIFCKYTDHRSVFLHFVHLLCAQCRLLPLEASF